MHAALRLALSIHTTALRLEAGSTLTCSGSQHQGKQAELVLYKWWPGSNYYDAHAALRLALSIHTTALRLQAGHTSSSQATQATAGANKWHSLH